MIAIELFLQYGVSGLALYLMYQITYNHLTTIETGIDETNRLLREILSKI